jgi:hypothetical protein
VTVRVGAAQPTVMGMEQIASGGGARTRDRSQGVRFVQQVISENRAELRRADLRASQAMVVAAVVAVGLIAAMTSRAWAPSYDSPVSPWLWWAGCTLWAVSVAALVLALMPRPGWADGGRYRRRGPAPGAAPLEREVAEMDRTAGAVLRKYRMVRLGVLALAAATMLFAASGLR